jgi:hypothetical protein
MKPKINKLEGGTLTRETIGAYMKVSKEYLKSGQVEDDHIYDLLTERLYGYIAVAAKEEGEFPVFVERPTFIDWLLRRSKTIQVPYKIRHLCQVKFLDEDEVIPTIKFNK